MNKLGGLKQHGAFNPMGANGQKTPVDSAGGLMDAGPSGKSVPLAKSTDAKSAMIDGPYGGKVKA